MKMEGGGAVGMPGVVKRLRNLRAGEDEVEGEKSEGKKW